ncbi:MAG: hypothetical protein IPN49_10065 [Saprospiraceae bacterium]|nr:hypothetical protein [Saprospiraceae bacterium]
MKNIFTNALIFTFLICFFCAIDINAQTDNVKFKDSELTAFAVIFNESRKTQSSLDVEIISLLQEYNISYQRYREVLTNNIEGVNTNEFTENEKKFIEAIQQKNEVLRARVEKMEMEKCKELNISSATYYSIKRKIFKFPKFQNEIYPYFQQQEISPDKD